MASRSIRASALTSARSFRLMNEILRGPAPPAFKAYLLDRFRQVTLVLVADNVSDADKIGLTQRFDRFIEVAHAVKLAYCEEACHE